jgi:hypothetical protein
MKKQDITDDLKAVAGLQDYEAVEVLWVALVKAANTMPGKSERDRTMALVRKIETKEISQCLSLPEVEALTCLDPPLETILADPNERLESKKAAQALATVRSSREADPRAALIALGEVLKRIRNKRAHGFKARGTPRDAEILRAARQILSRLCEVAVAQVP